ncbi:E2 ubiquitin-conjugating enzyme [Malassezia yamatoensis]|uniref:E2 ubiquitin-conjugating enzyme n=1 Tax=Malassezia yamatoensis TaxID=253288 RepID=A0AAJ6CGG4_9BASI|nr:E2 ubiquitin-conjugating enzyme [Malassezia yamatoensis]
MSELSELEKDSNPEYRAVPTEDNLFEWHFTLRGPRNTEFDSGMYHGKIILPTEYPFKPPDVMFLTPNGRWEVNRKVKFMASQPAKITDQDDSFNTSVQHEAIQPNGETTTYAAQETISSLDPNRPNGPKDDDQADISTRSPTEEDRENHTPHGTLGESNPTETLETTGGSISRSEPDRQTAESMQEPRAEPAFVATPSNNHTHFSIAATFQARVQVYTKLVMLMDAICGAISALLVIWVLKHI